MKLLVISNRESDLLSLLASTASVTLVSPDATAIENIDKYDSLAILGGTEKRPLIMNAYLRSIAESFADTGKPVFLEYVNSFRCVYSAQPVQMTPHRLVCCTDFCDEIKIGDLLDSRCNSYIRPHFLMPNARPLLYYRQYTSAHDRLKDISGDDTRDTIAMFECENVLTVAFRLCDFQKACFAPRDRWISLLKYICRFLKIDDNFILPGSQTAIKGEVDDFETDLKECINNATELLKRYLVTPDGKRGIHEGLSHNILPDGVRTINKNVRADCTGEAAGVMLFGGETQIADNMLSLIYGPLTVQKGEFKGMMRWTEEAWNVCYQDDVARAIIPSLLASYFEITDKYVDEALRVLSFLCEVSCKDGLLPARTDVLEYISSGLSIKSLAERENGYKSAHYNAWYSAALLLAYKLSGREDFKQVGIKGLETLMAVYPDTVREHSETSELCRLIFPLAMLYSVTNDKKHYEMLDRVFNDLMTHSHKNGGFVEWDTGYKSACFNNVGGECSLLAENGDNVADLLYTLNWLPLGFAFAYHVCNEERFISEWQRICEFFIKTQIISTDGLLNGAWCRGIDLDRLEYYGIPHDVGWGPCSVETGWTVAEITLGMQIGRIVKK